VQVAIVTSATQAWQQVFFGIDFQKGDRILTSVAEYGSNYINFLQVTRQSPASMTPYPTPDAAEGKLWGSKQPSQLEKLSPFAR
jgi:selenocysteine lyase/cysteine desulfurase